MKKPGIWIGAAVAVAGFSLLFWQSCPPLTAALLVLTGVGLALSEGAVAAETRHGSSAMVGLLLLAASAYAVFRPGWASANTALCGLLSGLFISVLASHRLRQIPLFLIFPGAAVFSVAASSVILFAASLSGPHETGVLKADPVFAATVFAVAGAGFLWRIRGTNALLALPATAFAGCLFLVLLGFSVLLKLDRQSTASKFHLLVQDRVMALETEIGASLSSLKALKAFYDGSENVERNEFSVFARSLLEGRGALGSVEWIAAVDRANGAAFETQIRDEEIPGFRIHSLEGFGPNPRPVHYPIVYSEPAPTQEKLAGTDLGSDPELYRNLSLAAEQGCYQPLGLRKIGAEGWEWRAVCPVYKKIPPSEGRKDGQQVLGFVAVVVRLDAVLEKAMSQFVQAGVDFHLYDVSPGRQRLFLFYHTSNGNTAYPAATPQSWSPPRGDPFFSYTMKILGNEWSVLASPTEEYLARERTWGAFVLLGGGLICALFLLIALSDFAQSRKALAEANERMEGEITERRRSEEKLRKNFEELNRIASELKLQRSAAFSMMQDAVEARQKAEAAEKIAREYSSQLTLSEDRHRRIQQVTRDIIWDWNLASDTLAWGETFFTHFGYDRNRLLSGSQSWRAAVHPEDRDRVFKNRDAVLAGREIRWSDEYRFVKADGTEAYVLDRAHVLRDESGRAVRMIGSMTDITERKIMEKALSESEQRFRAVASYAPVGIFETDAAGNCLFVNELWCRMTGLTAEEAKNQPWIKALHPDDRAQAEREWAAAAREGRPFFLECRFQSPAGQVTWVTASAVATRDSEGKAVRHLGTVSDITVRKLAEEALKESERRLLLVLDATNEGIWDWNTKTGEVYFSPRWYESLGYAADEILYRINFWQALVHPDDLAQVQESMNGHIAGSKTSYQCEYRLRTRFGTWRWSLDRGKVTERDPEGKPVRMVGTTVDITERRQAQEVLEQFNRMAVGREMRMIELKKEINDLAKSMGQTPPYDLSFVEETGGPA